MRLSYVARLFAWVVLVDYNGKTTTLNVKERDGSDRDREEDQDLWRRTSFFCQTAFTVLCDYQETRKKRETEIIVP